MEVDPAAALRSLQSVLTTLVGVGRFERLLLAPDRIGPAGIGGFVGMSRRPVGEIGALRVDAVAEFTVRAATLGIVDAGAQTVITTLLGARRSALLPVGIQRISLVDAGTVASINPTSLERRLSFKVSFEFQQAPQSAEGVIARIPIELRTVDSGEGAIIDADFTAGSMAWFEVVDDSRATQDAPSQWRYESGLIVQVSAIRGGQNTANANKPGTYLMLRTTPERPPLRDFTLEASFRSEDALGGVGLVFRYQDPNNFYFFLMDRSANFRLFGRKIDGAFSQLEVNGLNTSASYTANRDSVLRLAVMSQSFEAFLDGQSILIGGDSTFVAAGRVGFMSRRNTRLLWQRLKLIPTDEA